ncbi:glutamate ABC transporter substrate-binding protein [Streptomyces sp. NPDC054841]
MKNHHAVVTAAALLAVTVTGCGDDGSLTGSDGSAPRSGYLVNADAKVEGSTTIDKAISRGGLTIGVKADQPFLGYEDRSTGTRTGFDIEIAKMVAAELGFSESQITWKTITSADRETAISRGEVDYFVGAYTINEKRKEKVSFAGPYYLAGQDLLVLKDNSDITGTESTKGKKVCSVAGTTSIDQIRTYGAEVVAAEVEAQCVSKLLAGTVDAVTTDDAILKGYAAQHEGRLKVIGKTFSKEPYGIGLAKDDSALREAINDALEAVEHDGYWSKAYNATLGKSGAPLSEPPMVERY